MKKKINWVKGINIFVMISLITAIPIVAIMMFWSPSEPDPSLPFKRLKTDYILMFLQCLVGIFAMLLPKFLHERISIRIPAGMMLLYAIFLYCSIYLGEVRSFYYHIPHWDTILHTFSGLMLGILGFSFITILNGTEKVPINLSPIFVVIFAFSFAVTLGVIWEFYEFFADGILGTNMQKFATEVGEKMIGRAALMDTMKDLLVDSIGAFVAAVIGYISLKHKKGWVERFLLKKDK